MTLRFRTALAMCAALVVPGYVAHAGTITPTQLIVFGDSLSDPGNAFLATSGAFPGPNYATRIVPLVPVPVGYFTDGANTTPSTSISGLWIDQLAALMALPDPEPALAPLGGTNYAVGSAQTGNANPQDMGNQVAAFLSANPLAPANALYAFWGGANDLFNGGNPIQAADNIASEIGALGGAGARDFLWLNLPPLGNTPLGAPASTALNLASAAFNQEAALDVNALNAQGLDVIPVDVSSLYAQIAANPGLFGFTDIVDPVQGVTLMNGMKADNFLFWDAEHPTTAADQLIARLALSDINAPEPASFVLTGLAFLAAAGILRRKRR
ncbi:MAG TPA: SGNH/GDSL hydrolase family protein [Bryobacteraceae bacterium]|nr:SGNH/GDSL hydrolase family protein [Bryobacteraceae bacterium]